MHDPNFPEPEGNTIDFHSEDIDFQIAAESAVKDWIRSIIEQEGGQLSFLNYIFCSDEYLHKINMEYLQHDTYTDIITFPYREDKIESDIVISIDRVKENAKKFEVPFEEELHRVIIHGVLHLLGFGDKTSAEQKKMRTKENEYIRLLVK